MRLVNEVRFNEVSEDVAIISTVRRARPREYRGPVVCPFCPGREEMTPPATAVLLRVAGERVVVRDEPERRVKGWRARVFPNKYPALTDSPPEPLHPRALRAWGYHEVLVESPRHVPDPHHLSDDELADALWLATRRAEELSSVEGVEAVAVVKNRGAAAGASLTHTHMQIFALPFVPPRLRREAQALIRPSCALCRMLEGEQGGPRIVFEGEHFAVLCPPAPRAPYEVWVVPRDHEASPWGIDDQELLELSRILKAVTKAYTELLGFEGYNAWLHAAPRGVSDFHWHLEAMPVSSVWGGLEKGYDAFIIEVPPEEAAERLRKAFLEGKEQA